MPKYVHCRVVQKIITYSLYYYTKKVKFNFTKVICSFLKDEKSQKVRKVDIFFVIKGFLKMFSIHRLYLK